MAARSLESLVQLFTLLNDEGVRGQALRYTISGGLLALFYSAAYWSLAELGGIAPLVANSLAFAVSLALGWIVHSRWSFRGHGSNRTPLAYGRYLIVNVSAYGLNSFWVWLIVERLEGSVSLSILPILGVTPWICFWINRRWTFR